MADREQDQREAEDGVKVTDRRLFTADGQLRSEIAEDEERAADTESESSEQAPQTEHCDFEHRPLEEPTGVDFTMLINAMAEPALLFLGEIAHPGSGEPKVDLERARIQIDMLDLLRVKCRGNMSSEEDGLLDRILYQLRMLFVAKADQPENK